MSFKKKSLKVGNFYYIEWIDAIFHWEAAVDDIGSVCRTQGTLVKVGKAGIRIAWETGTGDTHRFLFDIPWGCILKLSRKRPVNTK